MRSGFPAGVVVAAAIASGLCGCGVPAQGLLGFTRSTAGAMEAVVQMCDGHIDGVTVYASDEALEPDPANEPVESSVTTDVVKIPTEAPITDFATIQLGPDFESKMAGITEASAYAWSIDDSSSADGPTLSEEKILALSTGQILAWDRANGDDKLFNLADFKEAAALYCR